MYRPLLHISSLALLVALCAGCATNASYVDPGSNRTLVTMDKLNIQDLNQAAEAMINSLRDNFINAGKLRGTGPGGVAIIKIERVINSTGSKWNPAGEQFEPDLLTKKISIDLNRTGKVVTTTTYGPDAESRMAQEFQKEQAFFGKSGGPLTPDYALTGKVIEDTNRSGRKSEKIYVFQLTLTSFSDGLAIWEEEKTIVKQGSRSSVGW